MNDLTAMYVNECECIMHIELDMDYGLSKRSKMNYEKAAINMVFVFIFCFSQSTLRFIHAVCKESKPNIKNTNENPYFVYFESDGF